MGHFAFRLLTFFSVAGATMSLMEVSWFGQFPKQFQIWYFLLCDVVLLGGVHSGLTFVNTFFLPEGRAWVRSYDDNHRMPFWSRSILLFICLFAYGLSVYFLGRDPRYVLYIAILIIVFRGIVLASHVVIQQRALYVLRNPANNPHVERSVRLIHAFIPVAIVNHTIFVAQFSTEVGRIVKLAQQYYVQELVFLYGFVVVVAFLIEQLRIGKGAVLRCPHILVSFVLWFLCPFSAMANYSIFAIHGMEYFFVFLFLAGRQTSVRFEKVFAMGLLALCCMGGLLIWNPELRPVASSDRKLFDWQKVLLATQLGIAILHVHFDSLVYRRQEKIKEKTLSDLLLESRSLLVKT